MTLDKVYEILLKHGQKFTVSEYSELSKAIADHSFQSWKEGREDLEKMYKTK